jgi:hypothetical protein
MLLIKAQGGCTVAGFTWENDGDAVEVPDDLAMELLYMKGADYSVPDDEQLPPELSDAPRAKRKSRRAVTEPAPDPAAAVTEPAPDGDEVTEPAGE